MGWIKSHWQTIVGIALMALPYLGKSIRFVVDIVGYGGSIDFLLSRTDNPGWVGKVLTFLIDFPAPLAMLCLLTGVYVMLRSERKHTAAVLSAHLVSNPPVEGAKDDSVSSPLTGQLVPLQSWRRHMTDNTALEPCPIKRAEAWLRECSTWMLTHDLDMREDCPMQEDPLDIADALASLTRPEPAEVERVAELQLAAFLAGRGSVRVPHGTRACSPAPTMDEFRSMATAALRGRGEA